MTLVKSGKVLKIKKTKNHIFLLVNDETSSIVQFTLKKDIIDADICQVVVGDVIECELEEDINTNSKYSVPNPSFIVYSLKIISKHVENLRFFPNVEEIERYSFVKSKTRNYLESLGYTEITVPTLMDDEVSSKAKSFKTEHYYSGTELFLRKTMDPYLRILSCCGMNRIYSIGEVYRNEHVTSFRQPSFEMLSIFTNYATKDEMIDLCISILRILNYLDESKIKLISYEDYLSTNAQDEIFIISDYPVLAESNAKHDKENNYSSEFKIKYKNRTIVHGVEEICDIDEYSQMLLKQGKLISTGDLEMLRNCIASGAVPCYNLGISLQRITALFDGVLLKDINPFPFSRIKTRRKK